MSNDIMKGVWPEWQLDEKPLGRGSYGVVYKAVKNDHGVESTAAIKIISVPQDDSDFDTLRAEGLSEENSKTALRAVVSDFVNEIRLMETFKGTQNIVSVEDYKVVEKEDRVGWDIFIRMELLTPFTKYLAERDMTEKEVVKLGTDMCSALELCQRAGVIHRDIKPQNIFVNRFGDFKLGDFGIARKLGGLSGSLSRRGTPSYMAPEIEKTGRYDASVDIYSLGMVLYSCMNKKRLPFLDVSKQLLTPMEREQANMRRISGEKLPPPCEASSDLASVILCACDPDPAGRFGSPAAMKNALLAVSGNSRGFTAPAPVQKPASSAAEAVRARQAAPAKPVQPVSTGNAAPSKQAAPAQAPAARPVQKAAPASRTEETLPPRKTAKAPAPVQEAPKKKSKAMAIFIASLIAVLGALFLIFVLPKILDKDKGASSADSGSVSAQTEGVPGTETQSIPGTETQNAGADSTFDPFNPGFYPQPQTTLKLSETDCLYGGRMMSKATEDDKDSYFSVGSVEVRDGFKIKCYEDYGYENGYALFELDGKYSSVSFKVGHVIDSQDINVNLRIMLYGEEEYALEETLSYGVAFKEFTVSVEGCSAMWIETGNTVNWGGEDGTEYGFYDFVVTTSEHPLPDHTMPSGAVHLYDTNALYGGSMLEYPSKDNPYTIGSKVFKDETAFGLKCYEYYGFENGDARFQLDGKYTKASFRVGHMVGSQNFSAVVSVYLDDSDEPVLTQEISWVWAYYDLEVDVSGAQSMRIVLEKAGNNGGKDGTWYGFYDFWLF